MTITTVIMGFLQICAGVVLLQLSKSAKDVPDAEVFKGDLDQVRTVAEQEEPEYEPRADTIRGGGALLRSISRMRTRREEAEAKTLRSEAMSPIGENEMVQWDGLRRRKTVLEPGEHAPVPQRTKTVHPPLGMSHFPVDDDDRSSQNSDMHPGIFPWRRRSRNTSNAAGHVALSPIKTGDGQGDTSYHGSQHIHFAGDVGVERPPTAASGNSLQPPRPPPHNAKRQFSFQNVFSRKRASSGEDDDSLRPSSSGRPTSKLSFNRKNSANSKTKQTTEEERLGLVKGDSSNVLGREEMSPSPPTYSDVEDDWHGYEDPRKTTMAGPLQTGGLGYVREESPEQGSSTPRSGRRESPSPFFHSSSGANSPVRGPRRDLEDTDDDATPTRGRFKELDNNDSKSDLGGGAFM